MRVFCVLGVLCVFLFVQRGMFGQNIGAESTPVSYLDSGLSLLNQQHVVESFAVFSEGTEHYLLEGDSMAVCQCYLNMSNLCVDVKDFHRVEKFAIEALRYMPDSIGGYQRISVNNNLAIAFNEYGLWSKAIELHVKSIEMAQRNIEKLVVLNNLGVVHRNRGDLEAAIDSFDKSRQYLDSIQFPRYAAMVMDNLYYTRYLKSHSDERENLMNCLSIRKSLNNVPGVVSSSLHLAECLYYFGDQEQANFVLEEAMGLCSEQGEIPSLIEMYALKGRMNRNTEDLFYSTVLKDSLDRSIAQMQSKFVSIQYESEQRERQNQILEKEIKSKSKLIQSERLVRNLLAVLAILLIVALVFIIRSIAKERELNQKEKTINMLEARQDERQKMAGIIHDEIANDVLFCLHRSNTLVDGATNEELLAVSDDLERTYEKIRAISHDNFAIDFDKVPFIEQLELIIRDFDLMSKKVLNRQLIDLELADQLSEALKFEIISIIKEVFANLLKHADLSSEIQFEMKIEDEVLIRSVNTVKNVVAAKGEMEYSSLRDRIKVLGGSVWIDLVDNKYSLTIRL